jgi:hypothetical protein
MQLSAMEVCFILFDIMFFVYLLMQAGVIK